ncbi:MAG: protein-disulfide reductase DsbD domain-containing protein [Gemmobacter sp.]
MRALIALVLLQLAAAPLRAEEPLVRAQLLNGWQTGSGTQMTGLHLRMVPGWKTYWRSPGDAGIPPRFDWSGSQNVKSARIHWPAPHVFTTNGLRSIGYEGEVVLPVELTPQDPAAPMRLVVEVEMGVCRDICVPATVQLEAALTTPGAPDPAIGRALAAQPVSARKAGLKEATCRVSPIADGLRIEADLVLPPTGGAEAVVIEGGSPDIWVSEPEVTRDGTRLTATADMVAPSGEPFALDRGALVLTVLGTRQVVEFRGCPGG